MRIETRIIEWFTLAELKAREDRTAYDNARQALDTTLWQGETHHEAIADAIVYGFAGALHSPKWDTTGEGDFPGIEDVRLVGWQLEGGAHACFDGTLTRQNAPALPWHAWLKEVRLQAVRYGTEVHVEDSDDAPYINPWVTPSSGYSADQQRLLDLRDAMQQAVENAVGDAVAAGENEAEFVSSEEYLDETAEANGYEFTTDGAWS